MITASFFICVCAWKVGSFFLCNLTKACHFILVTLDFGSTDKWITGSGNSIDSKIISFFSPHNVSPVPVSFKTGRYMPEWRSVSISNDVVSVHLY